MVLSPFPIQKVRSFDEVFSDAFRFLRLHGKPLGKSLLAITAPLLLIDGIISGLFYGANNSGIEAGLQLISAFLFTGVTVLTQTSIACYLVLYIDDPTTTVSTAELWHNAKLFIRRVFVAHFISNIIIVISAIFFIVPGIYFAVRLSLLTIAIVQEDSSSSVGIDRSMALVRGHWWSTFATYALALMLMILFSTIGSIPASILLFFSESFTDVSAVIGIAAFFSGILASFSTMAAIAIMGVVLAFQYYNLVERKEAQGLIERLSAMENTAEADSAAEDTPTQE